VNDKIMIMTFSFRSYRDLQRRRARIFSRVVAFWKLLAVEQWIFA